jgi:hypothetical protein
MKGLSAITGAAREIPADCVAPPAAPPSRTYRLGVQRPPFARAD